MTYPSSVVALVASEGRASSSSRTSTCSGPASTACTTGTRNRSDLSCGAWRSTTSTSAKRFASKALARWPTPSPTWGGMCAASRKRSTVGRRELFWRARFPIALLAPNAEPRLWRWAQQQGPGEEGGRTATWPTGGGRAG